MTTLNWTLDDSPFARTTGDRVHLSTCIFATRAKHSVPWLWAKDMTEAEMRQHVADEAPWLHLCKICLPAVTS